MGAPPATAVMAVTSARCPRPPGSSTCPGGGCPTSSGARRRPASFETSSPGSPSRRWMRVWSSTCTARTAYRLPMPSPWMMRRASATLGLIRLASASIKCAPFASASPASSSKSPTFTQAGFSAITCTPASSSGRITSGCVRRDHGHDRHVRLPRRQQRVHRRVGPARLAADGVHRCAKRRPSRIQQFRLLDQVEIANRVAVRLLVGSALLSDQCDRGHVPISRAGWRSTHGSRAGPACRNVGLDPQSSARLGPTSVMPYRRPRLPRVLSRVAHGACRSGARALGQLRERTGLDSVGAVRQGPTDPILRFHPQTDFGGVARSSRRDTCTAPHSR